MRFRIQGLGYRDTLNERVGYHARELGAAGVVLEDGLALRDVAVKLVAALRARGAHHLGRPHAPARERYGLVKSE